MNGLKRKRQLLRVRKYIVNKYFITCATFAVVFCFCGNQSLIHRVEMGREIREKEKSLREYKERTADAERQLRVLDNPDSLERYAREHYYMREKGEDVYIIR